MAPGFKTRLSAWHVALAAVVLAVAAAAADWALARVVIGEIVDGAVLALAETEAAALQADPGAPIRIHEVAPEAAPPSLVRLDKFVQIIDAQGRVVARSSNLGTARLPAPPALLARLAAGEPVFETLRGVVEEPLRVVSLPVQVGPARYGVQVAASLDDADAVLRAARWIWLGMSAAILLGIGITGALLARRTLAPIDRIVARAREINETSLTERLPHPGTGDEIGRLVDTLNGMLARIARSFEAQRRFTADVSHELRAPLSRLRAELEVTLRRPRERGEYEEALRASLDEVEHLSRLTEDLLLLARLDAGEAEAATSISLAAVVDDAVRRLRPEAARRSVRLVVETPADLPVRVVPGAAGLALTNVLDNAIKFSPPGAQVTVRGSRERDRAVVAVEDSGPGIAPDDLPRLFDRFYRGRTAASEQAPGVGLGLAIARALVEAQGGEISVRSAPARGATFRILLPLG
jgi:two-component system OmpR family sensor kinase